MTLYDDLGVPKDATTDDIKKANRKGVKTNHPDNGGDPEAFDRVQTAYLVLRDPDRRDPDRRDRYDKTGETDKPVDNDMAKISDMVIAAFDRALNKNIAQFELVDLSESMRDLLSEDLRRHMEKIRESKIGLSALRKIKKRTSYKGKKIDIIGNVLSERISQTEIALDQMTKDKDLMERAILYAKDFAYSHDRGYYTSDYTDPRDFINSYFGR